MKNGGHSRWSYPADKFIPKGDVRLCPKGGRKVLKSLHRKKARSWGKKQAKELQILTPERRIVYDFLNLPHHVQLEIGKEMGWEGPRPEDSDIETFTRWMKTGKEANQLDRFKELVTQKYSKD